MTAPTEQVEDVVDEELENDTSEELDTTEEETPSDVEALKEALNKERQKSAKLKARLGGLTKAKNQSTKKEETESEDIASRVRQEVSSEWSKKVILAEIKAALASKGVKNPMRLAKLADLDVCEIGEDGEVSGVDDALDELEEDYPEFFSPAILESSNTKPKATGSSDGGRRAAPPKKTVDGYDVYSNQRYGKK